MYLIQSGSDKKIHIDDKWAEEYLKDLGYDDVKDVPVGRGNDYLTTLVEISSGRDFGDMDFLDIMSKVRGENNLEKDKELTRTV